MGLKRQQELIQTGELSRRLGQYFGLRVSQRTIQRWVEQGKLVPDYTYKKAHRVSWFSWERIRDTLAKELDTELLTDLVHEQLGEDRSEIKAQVRAELDMFERFGSYQFGALLLTMYYSPYRRELRRQIGNELRQGGSGTVAWLGKLWDLLVQYLVSGEIPFFGHELKEIIGINNISPQRQ